MALLPCLRLIISYALQLPRGTSVLQSVLLETLFQFSSGSVLFSLFSTGIVFGLYNIFCCVLFYCSSSTTAAESTVYFYSVSSCSAEQLSPEGSECRTSACIKFSQYTCSIHFANLRFYTFGCIIFIWTGEFIYAYKL
jgi:hypothetical protein